VSTFKFKKESFLIRGAVFEVYREMGCGFLEAVYQECMEKELRKKHIPFSAQHELVLCYKGEQLAQTYKPDLICYGKITEYTDHAEGKPVFTFFRVFCVFRGLMNLCRSCPSVSIEFRESTVHYRTPFVRQRTFSPQKKPLNFDEFLYLCNNSDTPHIYITWHRHCLLKHNSAGSSRGPSSFSYRFWQDPAQMIISIENNKKLFSALFAPLR
jgi:hypothetical protein